MILHVDVVKKIATYQKRDGNIVCGNSDYQIQFSFDREWDAHDKKTARFIYNGHHIDVGFDKSKDNNICAVPTLYDTTEVEVGVFAGDLKTVTDESDVDLKTTTSAVIGCLRSILCKNVTRSEDSDRFHADEAKDAADEAKAEADRAEDAVVRAEAAAKAAKEAADRAEIEGGGINEQVEKKLDELDAAIDAINEKINYEPIKFKSLTMAPSTTRYEHGNSIPSVKLKWELSKAAKSIKVNGKTLDDPTATEYEATGPFTTDQTWTVTATDEKGGQATGTKSIDFYYLVYWGVGTKADGFDADFVTKLQHNAETDSKSRTFSVTPNTEYIYYVVPKDLGKATFKIDDGFAGGFNPEVEATVTKTFGERTVDIVYYIYRSTELIKDPDGEPTKVAVS